MDWLLCIAITVFASACNIFIDNYISDYYFKGRSASAQKGFFWLPFIIIGIIFICVAGVDFTSIPFYVYLIFILSGITTAIAGVFYYKALEVSDSTDFGIFTQLSPVFYLILGLAFLNQTINTHQFIAFIIILSAPILIILFTKKRSRQVRIKAILYTIINLLIDAIGTIIFVKFSDGNINFAVSMGFVYLGKGIGNGLVMLFKPKWRRRYRFVIKSSHYKAYLPLVASLTIGTINHFAKNLSLVLAPSVAVASAITNSTKPIVIFFLGILFTLLWPKFGREKMTKKVIYIHLIATIIVVIGICLIQ